ncbi:MAG: hypothetical protein ACTFAK_15705 [Candidatus Electronema sp. VV]
MNDPVQSVDTFPLLVCVLIRAGRDIRFPAEADFRYCAAKAMHYYGFKLGLPMLRLSIITSLSLPPARPHDIQHIDMIIKVNDLNGKFRQAISIAGTSQNSCCHSAAKI